MLPYIQLGPLRLWTYGMMLALGLWTAFYFFRAEVQRKKLPVDAGVLMLVLAVAGIIGAKVYHIIVTLIWTDHSANAWSDIFSFAGLAWNGGLIAGFAVLLYCAWSKRISIWSLLDAASPAAAIGYAFGRLGCFLAGDGDYGKPTNLPWGMSFPHGLVPTTQRVHPTPIYELLGSVFLFAVLMRIARRNPAAGTVFGLYLLVSGAFRFAVEFIRINPPVFHGLTEAQVISVISMLGGAIVLALSRTRALALAAG